MRKFTLIFIILTILSFFSYTQADETFTPYVTKMATEVSEMNIILTWESPEGISGKILIYRHTEEITKKNLEYF